jgi:putative ATP-dependent endonuclease of OLD family
METSHPTILMKIKSVRIQNLRLFKDETVYFGDYTCLVGPNGAGKSTVLCGLNIFFRETQDSNTNLTLLQPEDFHCKDTNESVRITVTFHELSKDAQEDFKDYFRQGELVVTAEASFNKDSNDAAVKHYGYRKGMKAFAPFFEALGDNKSVKDLKQIYLEIQSTYTVLPPPGTKDAMVEKLRAHENAHSDDCILLASADQFYGVSKGANRLAKYIQWVFVPAVKDATSEQSESKTSALGKLLARTVRAKVDFADEIRKIRSDAQTGYEKILQGKQSMLDSLSESLRKRIGEWAHPDAMLKLAWGHDPEKSIQVQDPFATIIAGEHGFEGNLARFGHGLQRSYLLALLQELTAIGDESAPRLILACEEPELYQHPPQAKHLAVVLRELSTKNSQIMLCTHSPYFVKGSDYESIRLVRKPTGSTASLVKAVTLKHLAEVISKAKGKPEPKVEGVLAEIEQSLQPAINEMFFTPALVLVEGLEDVAYIMTYFHLMSLWTECRRLGVHLVPANAKHRLVEPLAVAQELGIPTFLVFDSDSDESNPENKAKHGRDNRVLLNLRGLEAEAELRGDDLWSKACVMWASRLDEAVKKDFIAKDFDEASNKARIQCGQMKSLGKNPLFIAALLTELWNAGKKSATLERVCNAIVTFARLATAAKPS